MSKASEEKTCINCGVALVNGRRSLCPDCEAEDLETPSAILMATKNRRLYSRIHFGNYIEMDMLNGNPISRGLLAFRPHWVPTDPWRGHYECPIPEGWARVIDGWFCGVDGHMSNNDIERFHQRWEVEKDYPEFEMVAVFPRTSNVLTCGLEVFVHTEDLWKYAQWINHEGIGHAIA